jgi:glycosyltransferase involved in cell wall biosynthesis
MRVLLYAHVNPADRGGVQAVCTRLSAHLRRGGHSVTEVWPAPHPDGGPARMACALPPLVWRGGLPAPRSLCHASLAASRVAFLLARVRPALVNVHFVTAGAWYFLALRRLFGYRLVLSVHGSDVLRPEPEHARQLPRLLRAADAITAVSALTGAHVTKVPGVDPARVRVIPNGVDRAFWQRAGRDAHGTTRMPPTLVSVGRLDPVKGIDILLRAFARVRQRVPDTQLVVVGDGGCRPALQRLALELDVGSAVEFAGPLDAEGVRARLAQASLFVMPSRSEGLPLALLEALAAGVPVVAARVGGVPEILRNGSGIMVPPEDPESLAGAICDLLMDAAQRAALALAGQRRAADFSGHAADTAYEQLFEALGHRRRPPAAASVARAAGTRHGESGRTA